MASKRGATGLQNSPKRRWSEQLQQYRRRERLRAKQQQQTHQKANSVPVQAPSSHLSGSTAVSSAGASGDAASRAKPSRPVAPLPRHPDMPPIVLPVALDTARPSGRPQLPRAPARPLTPATRPRSAALPSAQGGALTGSTVQNLKYPSPGGGPASGKRVRGQAEASAAKRTRYSDEDASQQGGAATAAEAGGGVESSLQDFFKNRLAKMHYQIDGVQGLLGKFDAQRRAEQEKAVARASELAVAKAEREREREEANARIAGLEDELKQAQQRIKALEAVSRQKHKPVAGEAGASGSASQSTKPPARHNAKTTPKPSQPTTSSRKPHVKSEPRSPGATPPAPAVHANRGKPTRPRLTYADFAAANDPIPAPLYGDVELTQAELAGLNRNHDFAWRTAPEKRTRAFVPVRAAHGAERTVDLSVPPRGLRDRRRVLVAARDGGALLVEALALAEPLVKRGGPNAVEAVAAWWRGGAYRLVPVVAPTIQPLVDVLQWLVDGKSLDKDTLATVLRCKAQASKSLSSCRAVANDSKSSL